VKALPNRRSYVEPPSAVGILMYSVDRITCKSGESDVRRIVDSDRECELGRIVSDDEYGPSSDILPWDNSVEVDEGQPTFHSKAQPAIVWMVSVRSTIAITEETIGAEGVIVRPFGSSCNRKRNLAEHLRLEDALRSH